MTRAEEIKQASESFDIKIISNPWTLFEMGAEWADKTMIVKVCKWIDDNLERYILEGRNGKPYISVALTDDLRRAMEVV